jgi:hypothetical protein
MEQHDEIADKLEHDADRLEEASEGLKKDIDETREGWEAKQQDPSIPGAQAADDDDSDTESDA